MFSNAFSGLDHRRWFDRMFPQTLSIATMLLYVNGAFGFLYWLDGDDIFGAWRGWGGPGALLALAFLVMFFLGGFLMANGKLLGWYTAVAASFSPVALRLLWKFTVDDGLTWRTAIIGTSFVSFAFEAALCALLLHPMSRTHATRWFR